MVGMLAFTGCADQAAQFGGARTRREGREIGSDAGGTCMDGNRFDSLTRTLASNRTRRGFLGSLVAIGAGLVGARGADAQGTQAQCGNVICRSDPGVCPPGCVCCGYSNGNSRCRPASQCTGSGTVIPTTTTTTTAAPTTTTTTTTTTTAPTTTTTTTTSGPSCVGLGGFCSPGDCCSPLICSFEGLCEPPPVNECDGRGNYELCNGGANFCCGGICCTGEGVISCQDNTCSGSGIPGGQPCSPLGNACLCGTCTTGGVCSECI
jgi:hypothetical protein